MIQWWPERKKALNWIAAFAFILALSGEYVSYRTDDAREYQLEHRVEAVGIPVTEWFNVSNLPVQPFTLSHVPIPGSVELLINGLIEPSNIYEVRGNFITLRTAVGQTDSITIKYRYNPS